MKTKPSPGPLLTARTQACSWMPTAQMWSILFSTPTDLRVQLLILPEGTPVLGEFSDLHLPCLSSSNMEMAGRGSCVLRMLWFIQTPRRTSTAWYPWWAAETIRDLATIREAERVPPTGWRKPSLGFQVMAALAFVLVPT